MYKKEQLKVEKRMLQIFKFSVKDKIGPVNLDSNNNCDITKESISTFEDPLYNYAKSKIIKVSDFAFKSNYGYNFKLQLPVVCF